MPLSDTIIQRGIVPCRKCHRAHNYVPEPDGRAAGTWRDPRDGHSYEPMTAVEVVLFVREGGDVSE